MNSIFDRSEWEVHAECGKSTANALAMFPADGHRDGIQAAKDLCAVCPVVAECLDKALDNGERHGVWGGLTAEERKLLRRRKNRAAGRNVA